MITGAVVVVFNAMGKTLIVRRHAGDRWMPGKWALVGGKLEEGESSCDAVIREAKEETGLDIINPIEFYTSNNGEVRYYTAKVQNDNVVINFEHDDYAWVYPEELTNYQQGAQLVPGLINMVRNAEEILLRYA